MNFQENAPVYWIFKGRKCNGWFIEIIDSKTALVRPEGLKGFGGDSIPVEMLRKQ